MTMRVSWLLLVALVALLAVSSHALSLRTMRSQALAQAEEQLETEVEVIETDEEEEEGEEALLELESTWS